MAEVDIDRLEQARRLASRGKVLCQRLQPLKYQSEMRDPDERKVDSVYGPKGPAPGESAIDLELDLSHQLRAQLITFAYHPELMDQGVRTPPTGLVALFDWAWAVAGLLRTVYLEELVEVLDSTVAPLQRFVDARGELGKHSRQWSIGADVIYRLERVGLSVTTNQLRLWASRGHIDRWQEGRRNYYDFSQVVAYLRTRG